MKHRIYIVINGTATKIAAIPSTCTHCGKGWRPTIVSGGRKWSCSCGVWALDAAVASSERHAPKPRDQKVWKKAAVR